MSDKNLGQLISSLKTEAIDIAEKESERILEEARLEAQQVIKDAELKKASMIADAEQEAQAILSKGESALRQAARDYSISVRNELLKIFEAVFKNEIQKEFTPDLIKTAINSIVENIGSDVEVKISEQYFKELAEFINYRLNSSEEFVSIMEDNSVLSGFSIFNKSQGWSYTISPEEVVEALKTHLNKHWIKILKNEA